MTSIQKKKNKQIHLKEKQVSDVLVDISAIAGKSPVYGLSWQYRSNLILEKY